jgi:hypothetical protein
MSSDPVSSRNESVEQQTDQSLDDAQQTSSDSATSAASGSGTTAGIAGFSADSQDNPEVVIFLAMISYASSIGNSVDAYYDYINTEEDDLDNMTSLLEQLDNLENEDTKVNISSTLSAQLKSYGINLSGTVSPNQISTAASELEEVIDDESTQSSTSMDEMELLANDYETAIEECSSSVEGIGEAAEYIAQKL